MLITKGNKLWFLVIIPGCTLKTKAKDLDRYARRSAEALGDHASRNCRTGSAAAACIAMAKDEIATKLSSVRALNGGQRRRAASGHGVLRLPQRH